MRRIKKCGSKTWVNWELPVLGAGSQNGRSRLVLPPRFDFEPVFSMLLDEQNGGGFCIGFAKGAAVSQRYHPNFNILETSLQTATEPAG
jgi:hypothetical protein